MNECNKKRLGNCRRAKIVEVISIPNQPRQGIQNEIPNKDKYQ